MQNFKLSLKTVIIVLIITILVGLVIMAGSSCLQSNMVKRYTLAANTKYSTDLYVIESNKPGPVVMIVGGVHGSEKAGYTAAIKSKIGLLIKVPHGSARANQRAIAKESEQ